jgi:protein arginine N-methyltransferase 2
LERKEIYEHLLSHGLRAEFILRLTQKITNDGTITVPSSSLPSNENYLSRTLNYSKDGTTLLDSDCNAVMMSWEDHLMKKHTEYLCPEPCRVLNVGFGLGIIDSFIQSTNPTSHTIIEAHPDVYKKMIEDGWEKRAKIILGRWQDVVDQLEVYDAVFFDTFGEYYDDLDQFHQVLVNILDEDGRYWSQMTYNLGILFLMDFAEPINFIMISVVKWLRLI